MKEVAIIKVKMTYNLRKTECNDHHLIKKIYLKVNIIMNNEKQNKQLKLVDYTEICQIEDFKDYKKGILPQNTLYIVKESEKINLIPPQNPFPQQTIPTTCTTQPFYLASINNAICLKNQTILYKNRFILPDSFRHYDTDTSHRSLYYEAASNSFKLKEAPRHVNFEPGDSIFLSGEISDGFGHFLLEVVSRLWITKFIDISQYKVVMNPNDKQSWQFEILRALGIRPKQIRYLHHPTRIERLHIQFRLLV